MQNCGPKIQRSGEPAGFFLYTVLFKHRSCSAGWLLCHFISLGLWQGMGNLATGFNKRGMEKRVFEVTHTCSWHELLCHLLCIMKNVLIAGTGRAAQCSRLLRLLFSPHIWDPFWACSSIYFQNANMVNEALCFEPPRSARSSSSVRSWPWAVSELADAAICSLELPWRSLL